MLCLGRHKAWLESVEEFRYQALPGVSYHLREYTTHSYQGTTTELTIDVRLENQGAGTHIVFTYWVQQPQSKLSHYGHSIKARVLNALR
mgnify:CR=1 FL=1